MLHKELNVKLPQELSGRIAMLRFPLIVGVVFLHAYDPRLSRADRLYYVGWVKFLVDYVSEGLATLSVPLFFLLAGYLFFFGFQPTLDGFRRKLLNRAKTLLIPLMFWNLLCLGLLALAQSNPGSAQFFSGRSEPIASFTPEQYLNAIFGFTSHPIAFQFWFIRDLFVLVLLSPMIHVLLKKLPFIFLLVLGLRWFSGSTAWTIPFLSREAMFFFSIGGLLALQEISLEMLDRGWKLAMLYLPWSIVDALTKSKTFNNPIHKLAELLGVVFVFCATRHAHKSSRWTRSLVSLSSASFFIFAVHEPLLTVVRKLSYYILRPAGNGGIVFLYFTDPIVVIAICLLGYLICTKTMPLSTSVVTGGRTRKAAPQLTLLPGVQATAQAFEP